jgi:hypothetical protein
MTSPGLKLVLKRVDEACIVNPSKEVDTISQIPLAP